MTYMRLTDVFDDCWEKPWGELSGDQRIAWHEALGPCAGDINALGNQWNSVDAKGRKLVVERHDIQHDPAMAETNEALASVGYKIRALKAMGDRGKPSEFMAKQDGLERLGTKADAFFTPTSGAAVTPIQEDDAGATAIALDLPKGGEPKKFGADEMAEKVSNYWTALDVSRQATTITTNRLKNRGNPLDAVIELATKAALAPNDAHSVWAELEKMAEAENKQAPLIGYSSDGIQYRGKKYQESGEPDTFTLKNLRDRMRRAKAR